MLDSGLGEDPVFQEYDKKMQKKCELESKKANGKLAPEEEEKLKELNEEVNELMQKLRRKR